MWASRREVWGEAVKPRSEARGGDGEVSRSSGSLKLVETLVQIAVARSGDGC